MGSAVIFANLDVALRRFRQKFKTRTLWADAICINQADLSERSQQVSLMSTIYTKAEHVIAWIGLDEKGDAKFAFGRMSQINERLENEWASNPPDDYEDDERNDMVTVATLKPEHRLLQGDRVKSALKSFYEHPYFERAWVQQEIGLANEVDIYWGEWTISWEIIRRCVWHLYFLNRAHGARRLPSSITDVYHLPLLYSARLFQTKAQENRTHGIFNYKSRLGEEPLKFSSILPDARFLQAEDPRDFVFSLLSHPAATRFDGSHIIKADYTKSLTDIMWELTAALISDDLGILSAVFHDDNSLRSATPSWVVDLLRLRREARSKLHYWPYYCAGTRVKTVKPIVKINEAHSAITLRGLFLDIVDDSSTSFGDPDFDSEATSQHPLQLALDFIQRNNNHCHYSDQNRVLLSSLLLVAGKPSFGGPDGQQADFYAYCRDYSLGPAVSADLMNEASVTSLQITDYADRGSSAEYIGQAWDACFHSKLFRTTKNYLGLGPQILKAGDVVAVIFGAKVPFILRPDGDHYLLLGDCYVHGIMKGEAVEEWVSANPEKFKDVEFNVW
ncbi:Heterokaryon incompatibility protein (HET) domain containing protein [Hyaloscypha variabilis]